MKELSIEEKARAYDEAIKIATEYFNSPRTCVDIDVLPKLFPELAESEDERIRKELLNAFQESEDSIYIVLTPHKRESFIAWLEKQGNLMKALQISNAKIGELIEKNYYLKEQIEKQGENSMGISEATKQKLEDNLNKALEKETPESCNEFLEKQGEPKKHDVCDNCEQQGGCVSPCPMKLVEKQGEQKPITNVPPREVILAIWDLGNEWKELTNGSISTEYGTQLDYIQKHWHESEYYLKEKQSEQRPANKVEPKFKR